jgi:hypothetical protein
LSLQKSNEKEFLFPKKISDSENSSTTHHNNQREPDSHTQASEPKAIANRSFGLEKVVYSFAAVLIFISGIYFGTKYLPADVENNYNSPAKPTPSIKKENNLHKRSSTSSYFEPEDFFPAAEFRKQGAILIGCQNNLNKMSKLYVDIARAIGGRVPLIGVVPTEVQALEGASIMKQHGLPPEAMRFIAMPSNSIWIRDYAPFILRYDQDRALLIDAKYQTSYRAGKKETGRLLQYGTGPYSRSARTLNSSHARRWQSAEQWGWHDPYKR